MIRSVGIWKVSPYSQTLNMQLYKFFNFTLNKFLFKIKSISGLVLVSRTNDVGWSDRFREKCQSIYSSDTKKGVITSRQQYGDHGSRYPLGSV